MSSLLFFSHLMLLVQQMEGYLACRRSSSNYCENPLSGDPDQLVVTRLYLILVFQTRTEPDLAGFRNSNPARSVARFGENLFLDHRTICLMKLTASITLPDAIKREYSSVLPLSYVTVWQFWQNWWNDNKFFFVRVTLIKTVNTPLDRSPARVLSVSNWMLRSGTGIRQIWLEIWTGAAEPIRHGLFSVPLLITWCPQNALNCTDLHLHIFKNFPGVTPRTCKTGEGVSPLPRSLPPTNAHCPTFSQLPRPLNLDGNGLGWIPQKWQDSGFAKIQYNSGGNSGKNSRLNQKIKSGTRVNKSLLFVNTEKSTLRKPNMQIWRSSTLYRHGPDLAR